MNANPIKTHLAPLALSAALSLGLLVCPVSADETDHASIRVDLVLGSQNDRKRLFHPDRLELKVGQRYTLVVSNPSMEIHEFHSPGLVEASWSSEVKVLDGIGEATFPMAVIVGTPDEIEIAPGSTVEWTFVAVKPGTYEMVCDTLDQQHKTHTEAGMLGKIVIR